MSHMGRRGSPKSSYAAFPQCFHQSISLKVSSHRSESLLYVMRCQGSLHARHTHTVRKLHCKAEGRQRAGGKNDSIIIIRSGTAGLCRLR